MRRNLFILITILSFSFIPNVRSVNPYSILDLPLDSSVDQIKQKYRKLIKSKASNDMKDIYTQAYQEIMLE